MPRKTISEPQAIFKWRGRLMEVVSYFEGSGKVISFQPIGAKPCEHCGQIEHHSQVDTSPLWQENAEPVETLITI